MRTQAPSGMTGQVADAYRTLARLHYRPAAPSDGCGNIAVPEENLNLEREAREYAEHWCDEQSTGKYRLGVPHYSLRPAMIYAVEAARLMCGAPKQRQLIKGLLREAIRAVENA
ncbi:MAG: hypothetical protein WAJ96_09915 [Candidatus Acidiferrum sp.]